MKTLILLSLSALLMSCGNLIKNGAMVDAQDALDGNKYAKALEYTDIAESFGDLSESEIAKLHYLKAQSLEGLGQHEDAVLSYRYVVAQHGSSAYAGLAQRRLNDMSHLPGRTD